ncbi:MAG: ribonuclease Z [Bacteroidetes bacterium CHB5]|nr:ribonuclease Z [Bacteroidetes bacterium CHB5]
MSFALTILGSSGALPAFGRFPSSQYLTIQNQHFLIDCGEGAQMQLMKYKIPVHKINRIFISHLHGDHYLGLMGLLFSMHLQKRVNDLYLHAPKGLDEIILLQLKYSKSTLSYTIRFHLFDPDQPTTLFENEAVSVETIPLLHKLPCAGFLFREKQKPFKLDKEKLLPSMKLQHLALLKTGSDVYDETGKLLYRNSDFTLPPAPSYSYAYCSDTAWNEKMIEQLKNIDLLYHEATFMEEERSKAIETKHSTTLDAARMAQAVHAGKLLIGHFSARYRELEPLLIETKSIFANTALAIEGNTYTLPHEQNH